MIFNYKQYKVIKVRGYFRVNKNFFAVACANKRSSIWLKIKQNLSKLELNYCKIENKSTNRVLKRSILKALRHIINGPIFFFKSSDNLQMLQKTWLVDNLEPFVFNMLILKFNNKVYSIKNHENLEDLNYKINILLFYQFNIITTKWLYNFFFSYNKPLKKIGFEPTMS
jgi:hypothetical protein